MQELWDELQKLKGFIPRNTYSTIRGQIKRGDTEGAAIGIKRLKERLGK